MRAIRATAHLHILTEGATGRAVELRAQANRQIHADGAVVFTFPRHCLRTGAAGHGVDHPIKIFVALVGGAFKGQIFLHGEAVRLASRHKGHGLDPNPADVAWAPLELAALECQSRQGKIILLYEDETVIWRFALPRAGWWRRAQRYRLPTRPLSHSQITREETRKRQAWTGYRSWSRLTSGVLRHVIGAVQYGTARGLDKIVPHFDAQDFRQYRHHVLAIFAKPGKAVVMVVDRSGLQRAGQLVSTLAHDVGDAAPYFSLS
jgi:IS1 family transposase